jgi:hypothetical protein
LELTVLLPLPFWNLQVCSNATLLLTEIILISAEKAFEKFQHPS